MGLASSGGSIEGFVFLDSDTDGALGPTEPGLRIVRVQLKGPVDRTVLSSMNGAYRFTDLPAGSYDISVDPGPDWEVQSQGMYAGLAVDGDALENVNFALVAACLHQALASVGPVSYPDVAAAYVLANIASLIAHVPGGLGVIEAVVATVLPGAGVVAGLIVFRLVYFLVPLLPGAALLAFSLMSRRKS